ncbi:MAG: class I SAM-dependent methyltransferase [Lysobacterales bacterium]
MPRRLTGSEAIEDYVWDYARESDVARRLRAETALLPNSGMQIGPDHAALLALLVQASGARRAIEIGTFTGMSALAVASALPADGLLVCCDVSEEWTAIARRYWTEAGVSGRIDLRIAPAIETLAALHAANGAPFDFAFIDADKTGYPDYYEACLALLRTGGFVVLDNMLWSGRVTDPHDHDADTEVLRNLATRIRGDTRVDSVLLTVGDGVLVARKR